VPEFRKDPITGGWVIFSPERSKRPNGFVPATSAAVESVPCPFCPGHEAETPREIMRFPGSVEYPDHPWSLRVVEDRRPLLAPEGGHHRYGEGMFDLMSGFGFHELVVESPCHTDGYLTYPESHVRNLLLSYQSRFADLGRREGIQQILVTRNTGTGGAPSRVHPHSHLVALPIVPKRILEECLGCLKYYKFKERCLSCDIIHQETRDRSRVVLENEGFVAFCAYAGRFPYEVVITPKGHSSRYEEIRPNEIALLAQMLKSVLTALKRHLKGPPMSFIFHTAPTAQAQHEELAAVSQYYHWHIEIIPRLTRTAGFEWGSGFYINPVLPEDSARWLRESFQDATSS
jgi:UDPglucose--hexose-1-phosphate uridylyltransferase